MIKDYTFAMSHIMSDGDIIISLVVNLQRISYRSVYQYQTDKRLNHTMRNKWVQYKAIVK